MGTGQILSFADDHPIENNKKAIKLNIQVTENSSTIGPNGITNNSSLDIPKFGKKVTVLVNKYERDPLKRLQCIEFFGCNCQICGFNFLEKYGPLGENFCHVHHIEPLGEVGGEHDIDPTKDLIPVCPNCHAMLHRTKPSMKPDELEKIIGLKK